MKYLSIPLIFLGLAILFFSWSLGSNKIGKTVPVTAPDNGVIVTNFVPPGSDMEFILMGFGLTVLICGLLQWKARIGGSVFQAASGAVLVIMYLYLGLRAANLGYGELSHIYYLTYFSMAIGPAVSLVALVQLINWVVHIIKRRKTRD